LREYDPGVLNVLVGFGALGLAAPAVYLAVVTARLSAVSRLRRVAALRLGGAARTGAAALVSTEAVVVSVVGAAVGLGLFYFVRPWVSHVSLDGGPRWSQRTSSQALQW
jgi:hypothetical protein